MAQLTAKEARTITERNAIKIDQILKQINDSANAGMQFSICPLLPTEVMLELINLGYSVSRNTDPFGMENSKINW